MSDRLIAALIYPPGKGDDVDSVIARVVGWLESRGVRLSGTVQRGRERRDRCTCDMIVTDLASGEEVNISEDRGPHARGCRLDTRMLEHLVSLSLEAIDAGADVLVVNKFGKRESEGGGFRPAIARALEGGMPVVIGVNAAYIDAWRAFAGEFAVELGPDEVSCRQWLGKFIGDKFIGQGDASGLDAAE